MSFSQKDWNAEKRNMENIALGVLNKNIRVLDMPPEMADELGCTTPDQKIYMNPTHEIIEELKEKKKPAFRLGVFAHEMMHQLLSNFSFLEMATKKAATSVEKKVIQCILNLIEDPHIEYYADEYIGGYILDCLNYSIEVIYQKTKNIDESPNAFSQYVNALIQFGDKGIIKGKFTFPEAKKVFDETAELFSKGIEEIDAKKRADIGLEIVELSKPLWENEADIENMLNQLLEELEKAGKGLNEKNRRQLGQASGQKKNNKASKNRSKTIKKSQSGKNGKDKNNGEGNGNGEGESEDSSENKKSKGSKGSKGSNKESDNEKNGESGEKGESGESGESGENGNESDSENNDSNSSKQQASDKVSSSDDDKVNQGFGEQGEAPDSRNLETESGSDEEFYEDEVFEISDEVIDMVTEAIIEAERNYEQSQKDSDDNYSTIEVNSSRFTRKYSRKDIKMQPSTSGNYQRTVNVFGAKIGILQNQLKKIFLNDLDEKEKRSSGRINLKRYSQGTVSARIFTRRKAPIDKKNMAVVVAVDESGSMGGEKTRAAMETCIILAETFSRLNIPVSIFGFTTGNNTDVTHRHYVSWKNTLKERESLLGMSSYNCNFDGYSIRFGGELLKKKSAKHKLLIVISDGAPSYGPDPIADTCDAVRDVRKFASVLGISVMNYDAEILQTFYGKDFIHIDRSEELFASLTGRLKQIVRTWE